MSPIERSAGGGGGTQSTLQYDFTITGADQAAIDTAVDGTLAGALSSAFRVLEVWFIGRTDEVIVRSGAGITFNNDTAANYDEEQFRGLGVGVAAAGAAAGAALTVELPGASADASYASIGRCSIPGYAATTFFKTAEVMTGYSQAAAAADFASLYTATWRSTAAISRIALTAQGGRKLKVGSRLLVYAR